MKKTTLLILITALAIIISSCANSGEKGDEKEKKEEKKEKAVAENHDKEDCSHVHWGYEGEEAPENWANLCSEFTPCGGKSQSPINIKNAEPKEDLATLEFKYNDTKTDIINNGHTVQFNVSGDNILKVGDKEYKLLQYHFHALSEHMVNGEHYPIEAHFVHKYSDKDYAVVGLFYEEGDENKLLADYLSHFPKEKGKYKSDKSISLLNLIPGNKQYYYYNGSLTTPPCSEVVNWYVLKEPLTASQEQIKQFSEILDENYRPVMPLNERKVYASK